MLEHEDGDAPQAHDDVGRRLTETGTKFVPLPVGLIRSLFIFWVKLGLLVVRSIW